MKILRTIATAFAQYSRIPMPRFEWKDEDLRFSLAAFPLVGAVIGALFYALFAAGAYLGVPDTALAMLLAAVPLIVTGGFHVDGFMDVADALSSYRTKEEKLAILKDPHIGAFAVIRLAVCGLIYIASLTISLVYVHADELMAAIAAGFVLSRGLSALSVLTLKSAKNEGMLYYEATSASGAKKLNLAFSLIWIALASAAMLWYGRIAGAAAVLAAVLSFAWYKHLSYKQFGGITGDTAGYFVVICEAAIAAASALSIMLLAM